MCLIYRYNDPSLVYYMYICSAAIMTTILIFNLLIVEVRLHTAHTAKISILPSDICLVTDSEKLYLFKKIV